MSDIFKSIFPREEAIPEEFKISSFFKQEEYLVNGELRIWKGESQVVFSPVCIEDKGNVSPKLIGSYPLLTEKEALEALEGAGKAYDNSRGGGPQGQCRSVYNTLRILQIV